MSVRYTKNTNPLLPKGDPANKYPLSLDTVLRVGKEERARSEAAPVSVTVPIYDGVAVSHKAKLEKHGGEDSVLPSTPPEGIHPFDSALDAAQGHAALSRRLHESVHPELVPYTSQGPTAAAHCEAFCHGSDLLTNIAPTLPETASAEDQAGALNLAIENGGEGTKQLEVVDAVGHHIEKAASSVHLAANKAEAVENAKRLKTVLHSANVEMLKQCSEEEKGGVLQVDIKSFVTACLTATYQLFADPDLHQGFVTKEMMQSVAGIFLNLAKSVIGMSRADARDVVSLGTMEANARLDNALCGHEKPSEHTSMVKKTSSFFGDMAKKARTFFSMGQLLDGGRFGKPAHVDALRVAASSEKDGLSALDHTRKQVDDAGEVFQSWQDEKGRTKATPKAARSLATQFK